MTAPSRLTTDLESATSRLTAAFASVAHELADDEELRAAVLEYTDAGKAAGQLIERVIIGIKRTERAADFHVGAQGDGAVLTGRRDDFITRSVTWCISRYYGMPAVPDHPVLPVAELISSAIDRDHESALIADRRLALSVELMLRFHRMAARHAETVAKFDEAMIVAEQSRLDAHLLAENRFVERQERDEIRAAIRAQVSELKASGLSTIDIVWQVSETVLQAVERRERAEAREQIHREAIEWALEALIVA